MLVLLLLSFTPVILGRTRQGGPRVVELEGKSGFKSVSLAWNMEDTTNWDRRVKLSFCENQIWGEHNCHSKTVRPAGSRGNYSLKVSGLKMSTNYTFYLGPPTSKGEGRRGERRVMAEQRRDKKREATINLETRGFSARATECRRDSTVVEVETGPNFNGIVGAETKEDTPGCFLKGSSSSSNSSYSLVMDHEKCGSKRNASSVWTYVVVQESGAILTHSTRRFLVLCHFRTPGVFTVQAGFHLPGAGSGSIAEVDRSSRDLRQPGELVIITADSLEEARGARMAEQTRNSVNLRKSRTLSHHLLGSSNLGETDRANTSLLLVLLVAGAVGGLVIIIGLFFVCRSTQKSFEGSDEEGSGRDRERLAPRQRQPKRESKA